MKYCTSILILLSATLTFAQGIPSPRIGSYPSNYYTPLVKLSTMTCAAEELKSVVSKTKQVLTQLCSQQYFTCLFQGSCIIEKENGERLTIAFERYDEKINQSYFSKAEASCPYGYGFGKLSKNIAARTCSIPYFSVCADPLEHSVGDVIFIPSLVGATLPNREIHDGYMIISDYAVDLIDSGFDHYGFFTGTQSKQDTQNPLIARGLTNPENNYRYNIVTGAKAKEIRDKRGFKILKTFNYTFKAPKNSMLEEQ